MPSGVRDLGITQLGRETTKGTAVAATTRWVGLTTFDPEEPRLYPQIQNGLLLQNKASAPIAKKMTRFTLEADLTFEQLLHVLNMCVMGLTTGTGAGADKTWTFNPSFAADPGLNSFTIQKRLTDGSTNWDERIAYAMGSSLEIGGAIGENAKLSMEGFGRPIELATAITPAIAVPTVNFVPVSLFKVYIDDTFAGLGTTQILGSLHGFRLRFDAMAQPKDYIDGRPDLSFSSHGVKAAYFTLELQGEFQAQIETERTKARSASKRYVRLEAVGPALGGSNYKITIDLCCGYEQGVFDSNGEREGNDAVTLSLVQDYDPTPPLAAKFTVVNALSSLP